MNDINGKLSHNVQDQCRLNCSCFVEYIWEQGEGEIYSKNAVNCSNKNFKDFPDPDTMPRQTDTLYLDHNEVRNLNNCGQQIGPTLTEFITLSRRAIVV